MRVGRTGSNVSGKIGGHRKRFLGNDLCWIERRAKARPEIAAKELRYLLTGRGVDAYEDAVKQFIRSLDWISRK